MTVEKEIDTEKNDARRRIYFTGIFNFTKKLKEHIFSKIENNL